MTDRDGACRAAAHRCADGRMNVPKSGSVA
jgi:hypothetical protein